MAILQNGDFVRVKAESDFRPGQDGMVLTEDDGYAVGLVFGTDRFNRSQEVGGVVVTGQVEEWLLSELDLMSVAR